MFFLINGKIFIPESNNSLCTFSIAYKISPCIIILGKWQHTSTQSARFEMIHVRSSNSAGRVMCWNVILMPKNVQ